MPARRTRGRPARISRDAVLRTALALVDAHGIEHLSMRRLGAELAVDPMAIYGHVADKSGLYDGLVELVLAEVELPPRTGVWEDDLRAVGRALRATLLAHPALIALVGTRPVATEDAFALLETTAAILLDGGLSEEQAADGFDCLGRMVIGHALAQAGRPPGGDVDGGEQQHSEAQEALPAERYPAMTRIERAGVSHDDDRLFELALDGLVAIFSARVGRDR